MSDDAFVPPPTDGRTYAAAGRVGLGDVDPAGRLRLDALARLLQDVASADASDANLEGVYAWVLRRTRVALVSARWPALGEDLVLTTWCGGHGSRWAERRTTVRSAEGSTVEAAAIWVAIDPQGRPIRLSERFFEIWGSAAAGRTVSARLVLPPPPPEATARPWTVRRADLDTLGHVNNAAHWQAVEEALGERTPRAARMEFGDALNGPGSGELVIDDGEGPVRVWLRQDGRVRSSAAVWC